MSASPTRANRISPLSSSYSIRSLSAHRLQRCFVFGADLIATVGTPIFDDLIERSDVLATVRNPDDRVCYFLRQRRPLARIGLRVQPNHRIRQAIAYDS